MKTKSCKALSLEKIMTLSKKEVLANLVPAAAVIRGGLVLFLIIWRKGYIGGILKNIMKFQNKNLEVFFSKRF